MTKPYKIIDLQSAGMFEDMTFSSLKEIKEALQNYHSQDNEGADTWTLATLLDVGCWGITKNGKEIDYNKINI